MANIADALGGFRHRARRNVIPAAAGEPVDAGQVLRLGLALTWLLDAALQYQPFMFSKAFSQTLSDTAQGNPHVVAQPISWVAGIVADRPVLVNTVFATIQLLLAAGIVWRRSTKIALVASIAWSLGVWWFGEGLGGVLAGTASPVNGAPGAVILYALLAVVLWPEVERNQGAPFVAARALGAWPARLLWVVLWGSLAYLAVAPGNRSQQGLAQMVSGNAAGEPGWIAAMDRAAATALAGVGTPVSITLAEVLIVIAAAVFYWPWLARLTLVLAIVTAMAFWVVGENFGGILTGTSTDPNTGPLLALLALAYWPARERDRSPAVAQPSHAARNWFTPRRAITSTPGPDRCAGPGVVPAPASLNPGAPTRVAADDGQLNLPRGDFDRGRSISGWPTAWRQSPTRLVSAPSTGIPWATGTVTVAVQTMGTVTVAVQTMGTGMASVTVMTTGMRKTMVTGTVKTMVTGTERVGWTSPSR